MCSPAFRRKRRGEGVTPETGPHTCTHSMCTHQPPAPAGACVRMQTDRGCKMHAPAAHEQCSLLPTTTDISFFGYSQGCLQAQCLCTSCSPPPPTSCTHAHMCAGMHAHRARGEPPQHTYRRALRRAAPKYAACCSVSRFMLPFPNQIQAMEWEQRQLCTPVCPGMRLGCVCLSFSSTPHPSFFPILLLPFIHSFSPPPIPCPKAGGF